MQRYACLCLQEHIYVHCGHTDCTAAKQT
jgi:hypothetical protein